MQLALRDVVGDDGSGDIQNAVDAWLKASGLVEALATVEPSR